MRVRFVDASVFVHAFLRPRRALKPHEQTIKHNARAIVTRINHGEEILTSVVHMIEVANILEDWMVAEDARSVQAGLCMRDNVVTLQVGKDELIEAISAGQALSLGTSDALAVVLMEANSVDEIYSFDKDFDRVDGIRRISS